MAVQSWSVCMQILYPRMPTFWTMEQDVVIDRVYVWELDNWELQ